MIDVEKPKWQSAYFTGMPAPAGAITVLLPLYLDGLGMIDVRAYPVLIAIFTLAMAALLVSTIPTFSGKLLGERINRELVLPVLVGIAGFIGFLVTYPYLTMSMVVIIYLAMIPLSYQRYQQRKAADLEAAARASAATGTPPDGHVLPPPTATPPSQTKH
jgi:CDP-diacylglycerol--serine O-phosphatidyltransferase